MLERRMKMSHPTINYLAFCKKVPNKLVTYKDIVVYENNEEKKIKNGTEISVIDYCPHDNHIEIKIKIKDGYYNFLLNWNEEVPFTHFVNGEDAYKHCRFTKVPLGENLENHIFSRSPKFAATYAINITGKRLSAFLENKIFNNYRYILDYCVYFDIDLTEKQEEAFLKDPDGEHTATYGLRKIKGRLPETLHNYIIMKFAESKSYWIEKYFNSLNE